MLAISTRRRSCSSFIRYHEGSTSQRQGEHEMSTTLTAKTRTKATMAPDLASFVAGEWRHGSKAVPDTNPARPSEVVARTHIADQSIAGAAVAAAKRAFPAWRAMLASTRGEILRKAADVL